MRYLVWFALPFCAAVFLACKLPVWWLCWCLGLLAALALFPLRLKGRKRRTALSLAAAGVCLGFLWFGVYTAAVALPALECDGRQSAFTAEVETYPEAQSSGVTVLARMESGTAEGKRVLLWLSEEYDWLKPGDQLTGTASFTAADVTADGEYSWYTSRGVYLMANATIASAYSVPTVPLRYFPARLGHAIKENIAALMDDATGALLQALLTGDRSGLSDAVKSDFSRSGMAHLLAVSGLHVSFLAGVLYLLPGRKRRRSLIVIPVLICFALMTGGQPSTWRAVVMSALLLLAPLFGRETDPATSISFALLLLLVWNPYASESAGLHLSFLAVTGLACFHGRIYNWMMTPFRRKVPQSPAGRVAVLAWSGFAGSVSTSCSAIAFTLPAAALYFETVALTGPLANLLTLWAVSAAFALGAAACALYWVCPPLARLLAVPVQWLLRWTLGVTSVLGRWEYSALRLDNLYYRLWFGFLLLAIVLTMLCKSLRRRPLLPALSTLCLLFLALTLRMTSLTSPALCVAALDVGQGACTVFVSDGVFTAVDCGGTDAGNRLADFLQSGGSRTLSLLELTHLDDDHTDGVEQLLNRVEVETVALPRGEESAEQTALVALLEAHDCEILWIESEITVSFGSAELTLFPPVADGSENSNAGCATALCDWEEHYILVTGDLGQEQELLLLEREELPQLDVLVAGHHGSDNSTSAQLLAQLMPKCALISVGTNNRYGLPDSATLERLEDYRCEVYRTDLNGTIILRYTE